MPRTLKTLCVFGLVSACAAATTFAQLPAGDYDLYTFDELGHGFFQIAGTGPLPNFIANLPGTIAQDPFSGLSILRYSVPATMAPGDLLIYENGPQVAVTDIIRFDGQGHLFFFSQLQPGETPTMADVAQLPAPLFQFPIEYLAESPFAFPLGTSAGVVYAPVTGSQQPGSDTFATQFQIITSTPEPATAFLLLLGASLFLLRKPCRGGA